jgi:hypothetical protein
MLHARARNSAEGAPAEGAQRARATYERIARDFGDQREIVTEARRRLAALDESSPVKSAGLTARRIQIGADELGCVTGEGRLMAVTDWESGDLAIRDMRTGEVRRLNLKNSWKESEAFAQGPVFSPDQRQIAYSWYSETDRFYQVRVVASEPGAKPRILVRNPEMEYL